MDELRSQLRAEIARLHERRERKDGAANRVAGAAVASRRQTGGLCGRRRRGWARLGGRRPKLLRSLSREDAASGRRSWLTGSVLRRILIERSRPAASLSDRNRSRPLVRGAAADATQLA